MARLFSNFGYAVLETNHVSATRTGQIHAQYPLEETTNETGVEQGMLLAVDHINKEVSFPADANAKVMLHASEEQVYETAYGRNSFRLQNTKKLPKMLKLNVDDIYETNAVDRGLYADKAAVQTALDAGTPVYGIPSTTGDVVLISAAAGTEYVVLQLIGFVTLPNGFEGAQFVVIQSEYLAVAPV